MSMGVCSECGNYISIGHRANCSRHPHATKAQQVGYLTPRSGGMTTAFPGFDDRHLRALRLWHWKECLNARNLEHYYVQTQDLNAKSHRLFKAKQYQQTADFHLKAVQALNDCFDIDDTAEKDAVK